MNKTLAFELGSISLLLASGSALLANGLPGAGLIGVAALLATGSAALRLLDARRSAPPQQVEAGLTPG
ncbi:MAG TPA: hypothetical protein VIS52_05765 [Motiliproteus sp.]